MLCNLLHGPFTVAASSIEPAGRYFIHLCYMTRRYPVRVTDTGGIRDNTVTAAHPVFESWLACYDRDIWQIVFQLNLVSVLLETSPQSVTRLLSGARKSFNWTHRPTTHRSGARPASHRAARQCFE